MIFGDGSHRLIILSICFHQVSALGLLRFFGQRGRGVFGLVVEGLESNWGDAADGAVASVRVVEALDEIKHG